MFFLHNINANLWVTHILVCITTFSVWNGIESYILSDTHRIFLFSFLMKRGVRDLYWKSPTHTHIHRSEKVLSVEQIQACSLCAVQIELFFKKNVVFLQILHSLTYCNCYRSQNNLCRALVLPTLCPTSVLQAVALSSCHGFHDLCAISWRSLYLI